MNEGIRQNVIPARIQNELIGKFFLDGSTMPELRTIQNFVYNFKRGALGFTDKVADFVELARSTSYDSTADDSSAFSFGCAVGERGLPVLIDGSDENPLFIGVTTKCLIQNANRNSMSFVFHMDATFKVTTCAYPVCGVSDAERHFHTVAFFIASQRTDIQYQQALRGLEKQYCQILGRPLVIRYFMGDAEKAQRNAIQVAFGEDIIYFICFFHVVQSVKKYASRLSDHAKHLVFRHLYEMHYSVSLAEFIASRKQALTAWPALGELAEFVNYFENEWLAFSFWKWQCFHSPSGYAKTNNPVEQFNKVIKRNDTLRVRIKVCKMFKKLVAMSKHKSVLATTFSVTPAPTESLIQRVKTLVAKKTIVLTDTRHGMRFLLGEASYAANGMTALSLHVESENSANAAIGTRNSRRMKRWGQPYEGWIVDAAGETCQCRAFFKFAYCVHIVVARRKRNMPVKRWKYSERRFVSRRIGRKEGSNRCRGRPAKVSHALSID